MSLFKRDDKIAQYPYKENMMRRVNAIRSSGGEPVLRLLDLMTTGVDYKKDDKPTHRLVRDIGCRFGAGYEVTPYILEVALNIAEYDVLERGKTITVQQWHDLIYAIDFSLRTTIFPEGKDVLKQMTNKIAELEKSLKENEEYTRDIELQLEYKDKEIENLKEEVEEAEAYELGGFPFITEIVDDKRVEELEGALEVIKEKMANETISIGTLVEEIMKLPEYKEKKEAFTVLDFLLKSNKVWRNFDCDLRDKISVSKEANGFDMRAENELTQTTYWKKIKKAGLVDENDQPTVSRPEAALIANALAEKLDIKNKWKYFEALWNRNNMRSDFNTALSQKKSLAFQDKLKKILN